MSDILQQARQYRIDTAFAGRAHYKAGDLASRHGNLLGIPVIVTTATVGTAIFATLSADPATGWKIATGLTSLIATVLAALQTFFGFADNAEKHRAAGAKFGALRRQFDIFILRLAEPDNEDRSSRLDELGRLAEILSELASESPRVPDKAFAKAVREIGEDAKELPTSVARIGQQDVSA